MGISEIRFPELSTARLFDEGNTIAWPLLSEAAYPWEAIPKISEFIQSAGQNLPLDEYYSPRPGVFIHKSAVIAPSAYIGESVIIGEGAEIRHCAFIRGGTVIGRKAVVGNSTELKNVILFDCVQVPHYNYVGDSILGYKVHMGAGAITSNVKCDKSMVCVTYNGEKINTGMKKFGAVLGDHVEVGCGSVLNPGTAVGRGSVIYPLSSVRGVVPAGCIYKRQGEVVKRQQR